LLPKTPKPLQNSSKISVNKMEVTPIDLDKLKFEAAKLFEDGKFHEVI